MKGENMQELILHGSPGMFLLSTSAYRRLEQILAKVALPFCTCSNCSFACLLSSLELFSTSYKFRFFSIMYVETKREMKHGYKMYPAR